MIIWGTLPHPHHALVAPFHSSSSEVLTLPKKRVLVAFDTVDGHTAKIAQFIGRAMEKNGKCITEVKNLRRNQRAVVFGYPSRWPWGSSIVPSVFDYDAVVVGGPIRHGAHSKVLRKFLSENQELLGARPTAFFSVSLSAAGNPEERDKALRIMNQFIDETAIKPKCAAILAGAIEYSQYNVVLRFIMRFKTGTKHPESDKLRKTETGRPGEIEFTDWAQVQHFAETFGLVLRRI